MQTAIKASMLQVLVALLFSPGMSLAQTQTVNVAIDASKTGAPISKYLYG